MIKLLIQSLFQIFLTVNCVVDSDPSEQTRNLVVDRNSIVTFNVGGSFLETNLRLIVEEAPKSVFFKLVNDWIARFCKSEETCKTDSSEIHRIGPIFIDYDAKIVDCVLDLMASRCIVLPDEYDDQDVHDALQ